MRVNSFSKAFLLLLCVSLVLFTTSRSESAFDSLDGAWEARSDDLQRIDRELVSMTYTFSGESFSYVLVQEHSERSSFNNSKTPILFESDEVIKARGFDIVERNEKSITLSLTIKGTFSLTDTEIEFVWENGWIDVYPFSRTKNTFTLESEKVIIRFFRKQEANYERTVKHVTPHYSTIIKELREAKAAGLMFLADNVDMTFAQIMSVWSSFNTNSASFDQYIDDPQKVRNYSFLVVPNPSTGEQMLLAGKKVSDPEVARRMIASVGDLLLGPTALEFTDADDYAYMLVFPARAIR